MNTDDPKPVEGEPDEAAPRESASGRGSAYSRDAGAAVRQYILRRFESWLDGVLAEEGPPAGIAAEIFAELEGTVDVEDASSLDGRCDLGSLWSVLMALAEEVRLQGRAFKELSGKFGVLGELEGRTEDALRAHGEALAEARRMAAGALQARHEREKEAVRDAERRVRLELLELLLDLRDRLRRGLELARDHAERIERTPASRRRSWPGRMLGWVLGDGGDERAGDDSFRERVAAIEKGYAMTLERLEEHLARLGVREIECAGRRFDPRLMSATEIEESPHVPEGSVVEVYRPGYRWEDEVVRTAQVKVARAPRGESDSPDPAPGPVGAGGADGTDGTD